MDRFKAMQVFTRVVEAGSFTRAAETLEMPRATVTTAIQQLEAHLGVRLLNRTTRRVAGQPARPTGAPADHSRPARLLRPVPGA